MVHIAPENFSDKFVLGVYVGGAIIYTNVDPTS